MGLLAVGIYPDHGDVFVAMVERATPVPVVRHETNLNHGELWWLERAYEHIATGSICGEVWCGGEPQVHAIDSSNVPESTFGCVSTRCEGWRRHRLIALVSIDSGDLILGASNPPIK